MDENVQEKLRAFEKIWQRVSAAREEKDCDSPLPLRLMPKKAESKRSQRYIPYCRY